MKKGLLIAGGLAVLPLFLLAPGQPGRKKKAPFLGRNIAHRGLHTEDKRIPENSLAAFSRAAEEGYGMELDVQLSRDGRVVVFHDDDLLRVCGRAARVEELTWQELQALSLCGTEQRIPLLTQVLELVDGRTPLIVELKNGRRNGELCRKTLALLREYRGDVCVESFNPLIVAWFRFHAPDLLRGQLAEQPEMYAGEGIGRLGGWVLGNTLLNFAARPGFIAYRIGPKTAGVRVAEALGALRVGWTSHSPASEIKRDTVIFEFYRPPVRFK
jgi:glycerophosphoryl diester phosphodiesterase